MDEGMVWPPLREQCCDALAYLESGSICAAGDGCYDPLRPMGSGLWFAALDTFGLPPAILTWVHLLLVLLSVALSLRLARQWLAPAFALRNPRSAKALLALCAFGSLLAHLVFLQPVLPHALADPPPAILTLIAIWLALLLTKDSPWSRYAVIGILLGTAAFIRAYYLYPVLGLLLAMAVLWLADRNRRPRELLLALALLPIAIQYSATWRETGQFSYISPAQEASWTELHLRDGSMGYDTLLRPIEGFRWPSPCSEDNLGPMQALEQHDPWLGVCILASRMYFYFGSYAATTYLKPDANLQPDANKLDRFNDADVVGGIHMLATHAVFNAVRAPSGRLSTTRLIVQQPTDAAGVEQAFKPHSTGAYSYSVWLWSTQSATVELRMYRQSDGKRVAARQIELTTEAQRYAVSGELQDTSTHVIFLGTAADSQSKWGHQVGDSLLMWGGKLERGAPPKPWKPAADPRLGEARRVWSPMVLLANIAALVVILVLLWQQRRDIGKHHLGVIFLLGLLLAEGLVIVPEQRFVITVLIAVWTLAWFALVAAVGRRGATQRYGHSWVPSPLLG